MRPSILPLAALSLALVACSGDDGSTSNTSPTTAASSSSSSSSSSSTSSTSSASASTSDSTATSTATSDSTATSTATSEPTSTTNATSSSTTDATTGDLCAGEGESCADREACCADLNCCSGVPVPRGEEFCSINCPISDRNLKADLRAIDPARVLAQVVALPITTWRYKKDDPAIRHLGPMAQDFRAAFAVGASDRMIFPLDATGVSMAAIQGLHQRLVDAEEENAALRRQLGALERRLEALEGDAPAR
ncbi:MAG: tail fiber domain-containing protein [Nannocystaceae bacterium]